MIRDKNGMIVALKTPADVEYDLLRTLNAEYSPQWNSHGRIKEYNIESAILSAMLSVFCNHYKKGLHETEIGVFIERVRKRNPALSQIDKKAFSSKIDKLMGEYDEFFKSSLGTDYAVHKLTPEGKEYFKIFCL